VPVIVLCVCVGLLFLLASFDGFRHLPVSCYCYFYNGE